MDEDREMKLDFLVHSGMLFDRTGAASYRADVRVSGSQIVEIGTNLKSRTGERCVDAGGGYITPGFIESYNP